MTGSKSRIIYKPLPEDDPKVRQPDITRSDHQPMTEPRDQHEAEEAAELDQAALDAAADIDAAGAGFAHDTMQDRVLH